MQPVDFVGLQLEPGTGAVAVVLREQQPPRRVLLIVVGPTEAVSIAAALSGEESDRPSSHDVMAALLARTGADIPAVEITELRDRTFLADLVLTGPAGEGRIDSRPSDAIALALRIDAPMYVAEDLLDTAGFTVEELPDEDAIAAELESFRDRIDELGADAFVVPDSEVGNGDREPPADD
jgi:bifunctional DNase/RNase